MEEEVKVEEEELVPGRGRENWDDNCLMQKQNRFDGNKKKSF